MRLVTKKATKALVFAALILSLTACSEKSAMLTEETKPVAAETPGSIKDITVTEETESDPGASKNITETIPYEDLPDEVKGKNTPVPNPTSTNKPPKAEREDTKFSGNLPQDFTPPTSGKLTKQGSVLDGDKSFLAYRFTQDWQEVAVTIKESMKSDGWECLACQDFILADKTKDDHGVKYTLDMQNGTRMVYINISSYNGITSVGFNFQP